MEIQIAIFDKLYKRMCSKLDAWSMAFGFLGGATKETMEELLGMSGLERLCQIFGSADFLEKAMRDWSDDVVRFDCMTGRILCFRRTLTYGSSF